MTFDAMRGILGSQTGAAEGFPFGPGTLVFKVKGKMFALIALDEEPPRVTLKCDPAEAEALRAAYPAVQPGYYMHKAHWNTVSLDETLPDELAREMMTDSYSLVVRSLKKTDREDLQKQAEGQPK